MSHLEKSLLASYASAEKLFLKLDGELSTALDALTTARHDDAVSDITTLRKRAQRLQRECAEAWEACDRVRQSYWRQCALNAERELIDKALPLVAFLEHCHLNARSQVIAPGWNALMQLVPLPRPVVDFKAEIPASLASPALDRAEDEVY